MNLKLYKILSILMITVFVFTLSFGIDVHAQGQDGVKLQEKDCPNICEEQEKLQIRDRLHVQDCSETGECTYECLRNQLEVQKENKNESKKIRLQMMQLIKNRYTQDELEHLNKVGKNIEKECPNIAVMAVERIMTRNKNIKFNAPPIIKEGRTFIPTTAITECFGAEPKYNAEEQILVITKDDIMIKFELSTDKVSLNGDEVEIDVPAQIINERVFVPLKFLSEIFCLNINYDAETKTIEIYNE